MDKNFCTRLRELRANLSQADFALKIGTKQTTLSNWERGFREPGFSGLALISTSCGVSSDWLLGLSDCRAPGGDSANAPRIAALEKQVHDLEVENAALQKALSLLGGGRHVSVPRNGGAAAVKSA